MKPRVLRYRVQPYRWPRTYDRIQHSNRPDLQSMNQSESNSNDRLAARVVHRGGFGTCVPGAGIGQAIQTTRRTAAHSTESRIARPRGPQAQAPGVRSNTHPWSIRRRGLRNPHSVTRHQPHQISGPLPATVRRDQTAPVARGPGLYSHMDGRHHSRGGTPRPEPHKLGVPPTIDITMRGPTVYPPRTMNGHSLPWYSVPDSIHCSRASVLPRLGLARDPAGVALAAPIPHGPRAGQ
jgi:hypothetical protein